MLLVLSRRVAVHRRVAAGVEVLGGVAHAAGVALVGDVAAVDGTGKLALVLFGGAVFGIIQDEVGGELAVVVGPPVGQLERGGVIVDLRSRRGRHAGQP